MAVFSVRGVTAATAATANHTICEMWNPDSLKRIKILEMGLFKTAAGAAADSIYVSRITTKGTGGSTVNPAAANAWANDDTTMSACSLELAAFSVQPTLASTFLFGWVAANVAASGFIWPTPRGIEIGPGSGLAIVQRVATAWPISEVYFVFEE